MEKFYIFMEPWHIEGSVQEDEGPLIWNPSFQKQDHVTKKYINPSLTCHGTCRIGRQIAYALYNYKTRSWYVVIKCIHDLQIIKIKIKYTVSNPRPIFTIKNLNSKGPLSILERDHCLGLLQELIQVEGRIFHSCIVMQQGNSITQSIFFVNFYPIIVCMIFKCTSLLSFLILKSNKQHVRFFFGVALLMYSINFKSIHKQHARFFLLYSFGGFSLLLIQASHEPNAIHISFHTQIEWTTHLL